MHKNSRIVYKVTDRFGYVPRGTWYGKGSVHTSDGKSDVMCNKHWLHAYESPIKAALFHVTRETDILLWEARAIVGIHSYMKVGCTKLIILKQVKCPTVTNELRVKLAIVVADALYKYWGKYDEFHQWDAFKSDVSDRNVHPVQVGQYIGRWHSVLDTIAAPTQSRSDQLAVVGLAVATDTCMGTLAYDAESDTDGIRADIRLCRASTLGINRLEGLGTDITKLIDPIIRAIPIK